MKRSGSKSLDDLFGTGMLRGNSDNIGQRKTQRAG